MNKKSPIYTRGGDSGKTSLNGGERVAKSSQRVIAYGSVDELNSVLGVALSFTKGKAVKTALLSIQNELFDIGAELSNPKEVVKSGSKKFFLTPAKINQLEDLIDSYDSKLAPLHEFILPSGTSQAAFLHQCRTVCRRAEREVVRLAEVEKVNPNVTKYLNRLGDLLFVLARTANEGFDITWKK